MKKFGLIFLSLIITTCLSLIHFSANAEIYNKIVAIVNGDIITLYELNKRIKEMTGKDPLWLKKYHKREYEQICKKVLNILIDNKLAESKAKELGIKVSEADINEEIKRIEKAQGITHEQFLKMLKQHGFTYQEYREQIKKNIQRMQIMEFEVRSRIVISDKKIKEYYEKHKDEFRTVGKVRLASIFLKINDPDDPNEMQEVMRKAEVIMSRIQAGQDFSDLAEEFSEGPGADNGGDLGYFTLDELDAKLRKIVENMEVGEVKGPIPRPFGIQIIKLLDKKKAGIKPLKEVKNYIYKILYNKEIEKRYSVWLNELKKKAYIKIMF